MEPNSKFVTHWGKEHQVISDEYSAYGATSSFATTLVSATALVVHSFREWHDDFRQLRSLTTSVFCLSLARLVCRSLSQNHSSSCGLLYYCDFITTLCEFVIWLEFLGNRSTSTTINNTNTNPNTINNIIDNSADSDTGIRK